MYVLKVKKAKKPQFSGHTLLNCGYLDCSFKNFASPFTCLKVNLANWETNRESGRRKLLLEEAKLKEKDGVWTKENGIQSRFIDNWFLR